MSAAKPNPKSIFGLALAIESAEERAAYLERACAGDAALREEVEGLLAALEKAGDFLRQPAIASGVTVDVPGANQGNSAQASAPAEAAGSRIGPYKLLQALGEGGMGAVFLAEQTEPVKRRVALKIIKAGMDSARVIARFEAERQALALMDHPNIARVLDAGTTESGRPFFVMELVKGIPITRFCDQEHLTPRERLELFIPVCQAVQHAHQKGIIHRDLKPSNVLIALYDGKAVPKVIDFGVAKATGQSLTERTMFTEVGQVVGTLEYMSPEQAELNNLDIDTRADVYSLGVLLYELLTGSPPFTAKQLRSAAFTEMLRMIRESEPPRPSTRLSSSEELPVIAAKRKLEPAKLARLVRGDLDWIVMKCLEKERGRRYETANGLAMDVQRYLSDEPVLASPPSVRYRLGKFLRKHRGPVLAALVMVVLLLGGIVGTTWGFLRAEKLRELAETNEREALDARTQALDSQEQAMEALRATTDDVVEHLIGAQPHLGPTEKTFLENTLKRWLAFAAAKGQSEQSRCIRAEGIVRVARLRFTLRQYDEAAAGYREGIDQFQKLVADFPDSPLYRRYLANTHKFLGILLSNLGRKSEAAAAYRQALALQEKLVIDYPKEPLYRFFMSETYKGLAIVLKDFGRLAEAEKVQRRAQELLTGLLADSPGDPEYRDALASSHGDLGNLFAALGRDSQAESEYRQALAPVEKLAREFPPRARYRTALAHGYSVLGNISAKLQKWTAAQAAYRQVLAIQEKLVAEFPGLPGYRADLASSHFNQGLIFVTLGKPAKAEQSFLQALTLQEKLVRDHPAVPEFHRHLARSRIARAVTLPLEKRQEAELVFRQSLAIVESLVTEFPAIPRFRQDLALCYLHWGQMLEPLGKLTEAETAFRRAVAVHEKLVADCPDVPEYRESLATSHHSLAQLLAGRGNDTEALKEYRLALEIRAKLCTDFPIVPGYRSGLANSRQNLGIVLVRSRRYAEAEKQMREGLAICEKLTQDFPAVPSYRDSLAAAGNNLGVLLNDLGRGQEALAVYRRSLTIKEKLVADFPEAPNYYHSLAMSCHNLGVLLKRNGNLVGAERFYRRALEIREKAAKTYPELPQFRVDLGLSQGTWANLLWEKGQVAPALKSYARAITTLEGAILPLKDDVLARGYLQNAYFNRARAFDHLHRYAEATADWDRAVELTPSANRSALRMSLAISRVKAGQVGTAIKEAEELAKNADAVTLYNVACVFALAAGRPDESSGPPSREKCAERAVVLLRQAVTRGYKNARHMSSDPDLKALHQRDDFKKLLAELQENAR
jgi:serine/threonine protein kinase/tetratricopeptide (TPR) repeat protein